MHTNQLFINNLDENTLYFMLFKLNAKSRCKKRSYGFHSDGLFGEHLLFARFFPQKVDELHTHTILESLIILHMH